MLENEEKLSENNSNDLDGQLLLGLEFDEMNPFGTYEIIKKRIWVTGDTFGYCDGHAREVYVIKKNGRIGQEEFSSLEAAQKYIDDFLTKDKEEVVGWRYYFDKNSYWNPSKDLTVPVDWGPPILTGTTDSPYSGVYSVSHIGTIHC